MTYKGFFILSWKDGGGGYSKKEIVFQAPLPSNKRAPQDLLHAGLLHAMCVIKRRYQL